MKKKILIIEKFNQDFIQKIKEKFIVDYFPFVMSEKDIEDKISDVNILIIRGKSFIKKESLFKKAKKLHTIIRAGVGLDNIDLNLASRYSIQVYNLKALNANAVAEFVVGLIINLSRQIHLAHISMHKDLWLRSSFKGYEIKKKVLGIIGFGAIGRKLAKKAHALSMKVLAYDPFLKDSDFPYYVRRILFLKNILKSSDFISFHIPLNEKTSNLISFNEFNLIKKGAFLINTSRSAIIHYPALIKAIEENQIQGAALDVFEKEPFFRDSFLKKYSEKIIITPHIGGLTYDSQKRIPKMILNILNC